MPAVRDIVVVGGGTAGWMAAAALSKVVGTQRYNITLVESDVIGTVGVGEATIPMILLFNNVLGIDEDEFIRETNATFKLGIHFVDWKDKGTSYFHPFGYFGVDMDGIPFNHYWLRWLKAGGSPDSGKFNAETEAARINKFGRAPSGSLGGMPNINYAFHFDASLYAKYLRAYAEKRGVVRTEGKIERVTRNPESGDIETLVLDDGRVVRGDFFLDCTGFRGLLIEETLKAGYDDWSRWLPVNRAAAMPCDRVEEPTPYVRCTAREAGWTWRIPLQHRTGNGYVFCNEYISEDEALAKLPGWVDGKPQAAPRVLRFVTGRRRKSWSHNVVALGLSSGFLEPLESTSIHLIQVAISKLLAMFPRGDERPQFVDRFNEEMAFEYENIRDFIIAHYKVTNREDTPFWRYCKNMEVPATLAEKLEHFRARGEIGVRHQELFKENSWFAVLYGQGLTPQGYHPLADVVPEDELKLRLSKIRTGIQDRVNGLPTHQQFIDQNCRSPAAVD